MSWIIVGLGNPGGAYANTRHNAGFMAIDFLHDHYFSSDWRKKLLAKTVHATSEIANQSVDLVKPQTFMNLSGRAVQRYIKSHEAVAQLIVLHDDVHLPIGTFKVSIGRGDGGHNGVTSLIATLHSKEFIRIRIGVAPIPMEAIPTRKIKLDEFVLGKFLPSEREALEKIYPQIPAAIEVVITEGVQAAMAKYN